MQFTAILQGCKNVNFQMKKCYVFLIFALNIGFGYTLDSLSEAVLTSTHNLFLEQKLEILFLLIAQKIDCGYTLEPP